MTDRLPSRENVAIMSSNEYDQHIAYLNLSKKDFTRREQREIIICRKLIKNREYARISRQKTKTKTEGLEREVAYLELECARLREEIYRLRCCNISVPIVKEESLEWKDSLPLFNYCEDLTLF